MRQRIQQRPVTNQLAPQEDAQLFKEIIEPTLQVKLEQGLPLSSAEFGRLARQLVTYTKALEKEINELKVSLSRSRLDPDNEGLGSATKLRSKPNQ
jgi:hypothetical protein